VIQFQNFGQKKHAGRDDSNLSRFKGYKMIEENKGDREIAFQSWMAPLLFLLEVDPYHIFAYWEVSSEEISVIMNQMSDLFHRSQLILRIYEGSDQKDPPGLEIGSYFDIPVVGWKNKWYVEITKPNTPLYAELGLISSASEEFFLITGSNVVRTSRPEMSSLQGEQWMEVVGEYETVNMLTYHQMLFRRLPSARKPLDQKMIEEYYLNLSKRGWQKDLAEMSEMSQITAGGGLEGYSEPFEENPISLPGLPADLVSVWDFPVPLSLSSSCSFPELGDISSSPGSPSSWLHGEQITSTQTFQYEIDLVIYGRVQPGADLYIDGDQVKAHPDGTFSWRLNLSRRGDYKVPLKVILPGGEEIDESIPFHFQKVRKNGE
jgi:hypothetical protein